MRYTNWGLPSLSCEPYTVVVVSSNNSSIRYYRLLDVVELTFGIKSVRYGDPISPFGSLLVAITKVLQNYNYLSSILGNPRTKWVAI